MNGFNLDSFVDGFGEDYGIFGDVAESLDFTSVGIDVSDPDEIVTAPVRKVRESNKNNKVKSSVKRGRKPGQKPTCSNCKVKGHTKRKCPTPTAYILAAKRLGL